MLSYVYSACKPSVNFIAKLQLLARLWHDLEIRFRGVVEVPDRFSAVSLRTKRSRLSFLPFGRVFIIPILVLSFIVTESPRWLEYHDRREESRQVVAKLQGHAKELKHPDVEERYREIADSVANEKAIEVTSFKSMFVNDRMGTRRRLLTACSVQLFRQYFPPSHRSPSDAPISHLQSNWVESSTYYQSKRVT